MNSFGWDKGTTYTSEVLPGERTKDSFSSLQEKFYSFVQDFRLGNDYVYRDQLRQNLMARENLLEVDLGHMSTYDESLAQMTKDRPAELLPLFEAAVKQSAKRILHANPDGTPRTVPDCQVIFRSDMRMTHVRELNANYINKLVRIPGIVIGASTLSSKATNVVVMCRSCRTHRSLMINSGIASLQLPRQCEAKTQEPNSGEKCPLDPFVIVHDKCSFVDQQSLKLQEAPDLVPVGELPRHMLLITDRNLVNRAVPGSRVTIIGIYSIFQSKQSGKSAAAVAIRTPYLRVVGLSLDNDAARGLGASRMFTEQEEEEYMAMARQPGLHQAFANSIAPSIYGNADIKRAIACLLFGGSKKILADGMRLRGDINVLLLGDPSTAKSQLLKFTEKVAPVAVYTSGKGSSAAGLTASVVRDTGSREFYLEGGAMVLADGGVVCIDEFDKMRDEDRVAIHEAMEQQTISIAKAGITTVLNSRTSVLAAANPVFGRYDDMKSPGDASISNIDFQTTILSRFDMIFIVRDEHNEAKDSTIAKHVMSLHANRAAPETATGEYTIEQMRGYINYCRRKCAPRLSEEAAEMLSNHFVAIRAQVRSMEHDSAERSSIPITVRQLEAIIRITESLAKMTLAPIATETHVEEAIRLFRQSTMDAVQSGQVEGMSRGEILGEVRKVEEEIRRRLPIGSQISTRGLREELSRQGYSRNVVEKAILVLVSQEVLHYRNQRMTIYRAGV
ncbi:MCM2/3/5 family-domain-containing protein [Syncephalis fuscata]|nr:MCM2/3/5 family-domain-containing protein [Syncephalis fuscata]